MILTHGANSISFSPDTPPIIDGKLYNTVTIGNQTWMVENLDYQFSGITIGGYGSAARGNQVKNNEATYGWEGKKYGLLYNKAAVDYLIQNKATLTPGWHVPTVEEWDELITFAGGARAANKKLKSSVEWNGTDDFGFNAVPASRYAGYQDYLEWAYLWSSTIDIVNNYRTFKVMYGSNSQSITQNSESGNFGYSVRLVKDA